MNHNIQDMILTLENNKHFNYVAEGFFASAWRRFFEVCGETDAGEKRGELWVKYSCVKGLFSYSSQELLTPALNGVSVGILRKEGFVLNHVPSEVIKYFEEYYAKEIMLGNGPLYMSAESRNVLDALKNGMSMAAISRNLNMTVYKIKQLRDDFLYAYKENGRIVNNELNYSQLMQEKNAINHDAPTTNPHNFKKGSDQ